MNAKKKKNATCKLCTLTLALCVAAAMALCLAGCSDTTEQPAADGAAVADGQVASDSTAPDAGAPDAAAPKGTWAVVITGALAGDLPTSKAAHDKLAKGGETAAKAAGDVGHDVLLGTKLLGTKENGFLAIDLWNSPANIQKFYSDPNFAKGFAALFSGAPPKPEIYVHQPKWHGWGSMTSGDSHGTYYFVIARGKLKESDPAKAQKVHDTVAAAGEASVKAAGDVAHVVFTGMTDKRQFMAVDIWKDATKLAAVYSDPNFAKGFAALFDGAPTLAVYRSTSWHQW